MKSYLRSVHTELVEQKERTRYVYKAIGIVRDIVGQYGEFDDESAGSPLTTPAARWDDEKPSEYVWLNLNNAENEQIDKADITADYTMVEAIGSATLHLLDETLQSGEATVLDSDVMTIEMSPPDIKGYDGTSLGLQQVKGAVADLQRYHEALHSGRRMSGQ